MNQKIFHNDQIDIAILPMADSVDYQPLERDYRTLMVISVVISTLVLSIASIITLMVTDVPAWTAPAALVFWVVLAIVQLVFVYKGFQYKGYALRERDIIYKRGWLYKRQTTIPFNRIQHVDIRQGVIERTFDLCKLNVYTAGGQSSDLTIPGLLLSEGQRLKSFILGTVTDDEEE